MSKQDFPGLGEDIVDGKTAKAGLVAKRGTAGCFLAGTARKIRHTRVEYARTCRTDVIRIAGAEQNEGRSTRKSRREMCHARIVGNHETRTAAKGHELGQSRPLDPILD